MVKKRLSIIFLVLVSPALVGVDSPDLPYGQDITAPGLYIESGHYDIYDGHYAYDESSIYWRGSNADNCDNTCYIGVDFNEPQTVAVIGIEQYGSASLDARYVDIKYSDNCSDYTTLQQFELPSSTLQQYLILDETSAHRCWIVMHVDGWGIYGWIVTEMEMFEENPLDLPIQITGTLESGEEYQISRSATFGDMSIGLLLSLIAIILTAILFVGVAYGKRNRRNS